MAKKFVISAAVNGGNAVQHDVLVQDSEASPFSGGFLFRVWEAFGLGYGDTFSIASISGPTSATDPVGGWSAVPGLIIRAVGLGQISLAFID